jgi:hypothetical protein
MCPPSQEHTVRATSDAFTTIPPPPSTLEHELEPGLAHELELELELELERTRTRTRPRLDPGLAHGRTL